MRGCEGMDEIDVAEYSVHWQVLMNNVMNFVFHLTVSTLFNLQFGGRWLPLSLVPSLCSQYSPDGMGCRSLTFIRKD
jgi:hypothetical protein